MATVTQKNPRWRPLVWQTFLVLLALMVAGGEAFAQQPDWEFSLQQRRMHDQIHVEVWAKARDTNVTRLGDMSLVVQYNANALRATAATFSEFSRTDSIALDVDVLNPVVNINTVISTNAGYIPITSASYGVSNGTGYASIEVRRATDATGTITGFTPVATGRGAFIGKVILGIRPGTVDPANPDTTLLTGIQFGQSATAPGNVIILTNTGDSLVVHSTSNTAAVTFAMQPDFRVVGVRFLNPIIDGTVVNRSREYVGTTTAVVGPGELNPFTGYPIYFERSGYNITTGATTSNVFALEYSRTGAAPWENLGRFAEGTTANAQVATHLVRASTVNPNNFIATYATIGDDGAGAVLLASSANSSWVNFVTFGTVSIEDNRSILRIVLSTNPSYQFRSENARFRIVRLATTNTLLLADATVRPQNDISALFSVGRLFFVQFNRNNIINPDNPLTDYARTDSLFSNATQLTAEAWVNLNRDLGEGSQPAILASSPGPSGLAGEGTWMLYLHEGRFPAFRAREIFGRGNGYVGTVIAPNPLPVVNSGTLTTAHQNNWVHIAATVSNDTIRLFVDGGIVAESTNPIAPDVRMGVNGTPGIYPIWVGVNPNVENPGDVIPQSQYFPGGVKQARVWRAALPPDSLISNIPGVTSANVVGDVNQERLRKSLELYFTFDGNVRDSADNQLFQNGMARARFIRSGQTIAEGLEDFRPDLPHIKIIAPQGCEGVSNALDSAYQVRWIGYGLTGNTAVEFTTNGTDFTPASTSTLGNSHIVAFTDVPHAWLPTTATIFNPISGYNINDVRIRVRGTDADTVFSALSLPFTVAPNFATRFNASSQVRVDNGLPFVMVNQELFMESWIRPYQIPANGQSMPIIRKADSTTGQIYYALDLENVAGALRLRFSIRDAQGTLRTALSSDSLKYRITGPNTVALDSPWTHVGVYVNRGAAGGRSDIIFYTDGNPHLDTNVRNQLGNAFTVDDADASPFYMGYRPAVADGAAEASFVGELREVRYWRANPNGTNTTLQTNGTPSTLTNYVRGAAAVRARDITAGQRTNLVAAFSLDGSRPYNDKGFFNVLVATRENATAEQNNPIRARFTPAPNGVCANAMRPFIKIVEPTLQQRVKTDQTEVTVRWVGLDYVTSATRTTNPDIETQFATNANTSPIEISFLGGGGNVVQPYSFVTNASTAPLAFSTEGTARYRFPHTSIGGGGNGFQFAAVLNPSIANPIQAGAALTGTLTNARIRYRVTTGTVAFDGSAVDSVLSEGPLFTIVPPSNFTVRVLLEGYHNGSTATAIANNIGTTFENGGLRIKLYEDNNQNRGALIATAVSEDGYYRFSQTAPTSGVADATTRSSTVESSTFANVPFVFTDIPNANYWVVVEHRNHLPVMSRHAARFVFTGDDVTTANIESGWDFTTWGGSTATATAFSTPLTFENSTQATSFGANSWLINGYYSAFGEFSSTANVNSEAFARTGLIFNIGRNSNANGSDNGILGGLPAMVGGDVEKGDGSANVINALDRQRVRRDAGVEGADAISDVTGDGTVNGLDRLIVDRNNGRVSSILLENFLGGEEAGGEEAIVFQSMSDDPREHTPAQILQLEQELHGNGFGTQPIGLSTADKVSTMSAAGISFDVSAEPFQDGKEIVLPVFITNTGGEFSMGHSTFGFSFDNTVVELLGIDQRGERFTGGGGTTYEPMTFAPGPGASFQTPGYAAIEVVYPSAGTELPLVPPVPSAKTLVGSLRFRILDTERPIVFDWHRATVVLRANGEQLTGTFDFREGNGNFLPIQPVVIERSVTFTSPVCGDNVNAGRQHTITWRSRNVENIHLEFTPNNGEFWTRINTAPVNAETGSFPWTVPSTPSDLYLIRAIDAETGLELTRSECNFSVSGYAITFLNPRGGEVWSACNRTEVIRWDNIDPSITDARLELFNGTNWISVANSVNIAEGSLSVQLPSISTNNARLRFINNATSRLTGLSERFTMVCGIFEFITPVANQISRVNEPLAIRWYNDGLETVDIQFTADNGMTWQTIMSDVDATSRRAEWTPTRSTALARLRATAPGDHNNVLAFSDRFIIGEAMSVGEGRTGGLTFEAPRPNPASSLTTLRFGLAESANVTIEVFSVRGEKVLSVVENAFYGAGSYSTSISVAGLGSGTYYVRFSAGSTTLTQTLIVNK